MYHIVYFPDTQEYLEDLMYLCNELSDDTPHMKYTKDESKAAHLSERDACDIRKQIDKQYNRKVEVIVCF